MGQIKTTFSKMNQSLARISNILLCNWIRFCQLEQILQSDIHTYIENNYGRVDLSSINPNQ